MNYGETRKGRPPGPRVVVACAGLDPPFRGRNHAPDCWLTREETPHQQARKTGRSRACANWQMALDDLPACLAVLRSVAQSARRPSSWTELFELRHRANVVRRAQRGRSGHGLDGPDSYVRPDPRGLDRPRKPRGPDRIIHGGKRLAYGWRLLMEDHPGRGKVNPDPGRRAPDRSGPATRQGPKWVPGRCAVCGLIVFSLAPPYRRYASSGITKHQSCGLRAEHRTRRGGRPTAALARDLDWAVRRYLGGETSLAIAGAGAVSEDVVKKGIRSALALMPEPWQVAAPFRKYVEALTAVRGGVARGN